MAETPTHNPKNIEFSLQREYAARDFNRPPFRFPTRDGSITTHIPLYPQVDEYELFEMEYRAFTIEEFPIPPEHLPATHPIKTAYARLCKKRNILDNGMREVCAIEPHYVSSERLAAIHSTTAEVRKMAGLTQTEPNPKETFSRLEFLSRRARELHLLEKKHYFHAALSYLNLYKHCPETESSQETDDLLDETEAVFLAHMAYTVVRSAIHEIGAERKDGGLVVDHVYSTCLQGINRYRKLLKECQNPIQRHWLYKEMKLDIIRSLCHDYLEDFTMLTAEFLVNKLIQHTLFDTKEEVAVQSPIYRKTPKDTNFCSANKGRIVKELRALVKPPKEQRKGYIKRQILKGLPKKSRIPTFLTKLADRLHNLNTLNTKSISPEGQAGKVISTVEIIQIGIETNEDPNLKTNLLNTTLTNELLAVAEKALHEGLRLLTEEGETEVGPLEEAGMDDLLQEAITNLQTQIQFLRSKKAT